MHKTEKWVYGILLSHPKQQRENRLTGFQNWKLMCIKDPIKRMKRQPTEKGEILTNHISGKGLTAQMYKELP